MAHGRRRHRHTRCFLARLWQITPFIILSVIGATEFRLAGVTTMSTHSKTEVEPIIPSPIVSTDDHEEQPNTGVADRPFADDTEASRSIATQFRAGNLQAKQEMKQQQVEQNTRNAFQPGNAQEHQQGKPSR